MSRPQPQSRVCPAPGARRPSGPGGAERPRALRLTARGESVRSLAPSLLQKAGQSASNGLCVSWPAAPAAPGRPPARARKGVSSRPRPAASAGGAGEGGLRPSSLRRSPRSSRMPCQTRCLSLSLWRRALHSRPLTSWRRCQGLCHSCPPNCALQRGALASDSRRSCTNRLRQRGFGALSPTGAQPVPHPGRLHSAPAPRRRELPAAAG